MKITEKRVHGLHEMLHVDRCHNMDELLSPIQIIVQRLEPDCILRYHFSAATRNFTSGKSDVS